MDSFNEFLDPKNVDLKKKIFEKDGFLRKLELALSLTIELVEEWEWVVRDMLVYKGKYHVEVSDWWRVT